MNPKVKKMLVNAAMAGMIAGAGVMVPAAGSATTTTELSQNSCGGKDGCGGKSGDEAKNASERHACKGMNDCKGQGACKSGDNGCAGKNSCKGKGGCASEDARHACKGQNDCKGLGGCRVRRQRLRRQELVQGQGRLRRSHRALRNRRLRNDLWNGPRADPRGPFQFPETEK